MKNMLFVRHATLLLCLPLILSSCVKGPGDARFSSAAKPAGAPAFGPPSYLDYLLSSYTPGAEASHTLRFDIKEGDLNPWKVAITIPKEFQFHGFGASGDVVGGRVSQITDTPYQWPSFQERIPAINAAGDRIAFATHADLTGGNPDGSHELFLYTHGTGAFTQITHTVGGFGVERFVSIDAVGTRIAFLSNANLTGGNADLNMEYFFADTNPPGVTQITDYWAPVPVDFAASISGDGGRIALVTNKDLTGGNPGHLTQLFIHDVAADATTQITAFPEVIAPGISTRAITADGDQVVFDVNAVPPNGPTGGPRQIYRYDVTGGGFAPVTHSTGASLWASISADGGHIALQSAGDLAGASPDAAWDIFLYDSAGAAFTQVTPPPGSVYDSYYPMVDGAGNRVAFVSQRDLTGDNPDGNAELFLYDAGAARLTQITRSTGASGVIPIHPPVLNADGSRIAFFSSQDLTGGNPDGGEELFLFQVDASSSEIGMLSLDVDRDGTVDQRSILRANSNTTAYADFNDNGFNDIESEPLMVYSKDAHGNHAFTITMPVSEVDHLVAERTVGLEFGIKSGVFTNPGSEGVYGFSAELVSVDPDTGGPDNGSGIAPLTLNLAEDITVGEVAIATNLDLTPDTATNPVGKQHCVDGKVTDQNVIPIPGVRVDYTVTGVNPGTGFATSDANGIAKYCYVGAIPGLDTIAGAVGSLTDTVTKQWITAAKCDVDKDGDIDKSDLSLISKARRKTVPPMDPAYDANGDGTISPADVKACIPKCTRANCATQ